VNKLTAIPPVIPQPTVPERRLNNMARALLAVGQTPEQAEHSAKADEWEPAYAAALVAMMRYIVWAESPIKITDNLAYVIGEKFDLAQMPELIEIAAAAYEINLTRKGCDERNAGHLADELLELIPGESIPLALEYMTVSEIMDDLTAGSPSLDYDDPATDELAGRMAELLIAALNAQDRAMPTLRLQVTCAIREKLDFMLAQRGEPDGDPK
jgi:hypothetical protein